MSRVDTSLSVHRLSPALGAEIRGVDLTQPQPESVRNVVFKAWLEHHLVLIRDQQMESPELARFLDWFGPRRVQPSMKDKGTEELVVSNVVAGGTLENFELLPHIDHAYLDSELAALCLYALEVPEEGGDTVWFNAEIAYAKLDPRLKAKIANLNALHDRLIGYEANRGGSVVKRPRGGAPRVGSEMSAVHPVVNRHAMTGHQILYVNSLVTSFIVDLPEEEADNLLDELLDTFDDPEIQYRHHWKAGDVIIWDNRSLQHPRTPFDNSDRRTLRRFLVDVPVN